MSLAESLAEIKSRLVIVRAELRLIEQSQRSPSGLSGHYSTAEQRAIQILTGAVEELTRVVEVVATRALR